MSELKWLSRAVAALAQHSLLVSVCQIRGAKCLGGCLKARVSLHPATVSSVCGVGDWFVEEQGAELQSSHHSCNACCSGAVAESDPAQCMQLLALKTQTWCCMCSLHSAYPRDFHLEIWLLKLTLPVVRQLCQSFVYSWSIACLWMNFWNILRMLTCS